MNYYPAFLDLRGKNAVVVGGGAVAERKILALLKAGAAVTVISPLITSRIRMEKQKKTLSHISRSYQKGDLRGSLIVIAATDDPSVNKQVAEDAPSLVNVVDVPKDCSFIAPSVIKRGALTIAISTGGVSPALAKTIRKELEQIYGPEISQYLNYVRGMRIKALAKIKEQKKRQRFLKALASAGMLQQLRSEGFPSVKKAIEEEFAGLT